MYIVVYANYTSVKLEKKLTSVGKDVERREHLCSVDGNANCY